MRLSAIAAAGLFCLLLPGVLLAAPEASFHDLQLRLIGTAIFQGESCAQIEIRRTGEKRFVSVEDGIEGYIVADIQPGRVVFEGGEQDYSLYVNQERTVRAVRTYRAVDLKNPPEEADYSRPHKALEYLEKQWGLEFTSPMIGRVTSGFGARKDPMGGGKKFHYGIDLAAPSGTRIKAAASGEVVGAGYRSRLGNYVEIEHDQGLRTVYGHMSRVLVSKGQNIEVGHTIGLSGSTGRSTGPHLHFELRKNGIAVDPSIYIPNLKN